MQKRSIKRPQNYNYNNYEILRKKRKKKDQKVSIQKHDKISTIVIKIIIVIFIILQFFLQPLSIEIRINFFLSSSVNSGILLKSNLSFISGSFQKSFGILLFLIFFFL